MPDAPKLDVHGTALNLAEMFCKSHVEKACADFPLWDSGLGQVVDGLLGLAKLPRDLTAVSVAQNVGLLPKRRANRGKKKAGPK